MINTKFSSFCKTGMCLGCRFCLRGEKLVLFLGGKCSRNCWYCSLSETRKKCKIAYANERPIHSISDLIQEAKESSSKGAGVTGGDPLMCLNKTIKYCKALKNQFGKNFHIHIYLPLNLVNKSRLIKLSKYIDEIRFHPSFIISNNLQIKEKEIEKIKIASKIFSKKNTGIELPCLPEKKQDILDFILSIKDYIGFVNLNEFEISETNFNIVTKKYKLNKDTYTISGSLEAGKWIIKQIEKKNINLLVHLCSARTKDSYQFVNRLKKHNILPFGNKTDEGTVVYFAAYYKSLMQGIRVLNQISKITKNYYVDKKAKRIIIKMSDVEKVYDNIDKNIKIARVEEHPTFSKKPDYLEFGYIDE